MGSRFRRDLCVIEDDKPLVIGRLFCATEICIPKTGLTTGIHIGVGVDGRAPALKVNDVISLMKVAGNGTLTTDADSAVPPNPGTIVNHVEGMHGVSLLYGFDLMKRSSDELIATVTRAAISEQTKSFVETRAGATSFINGGADLLAGAGMTSAKKEGSGDKDKDARGYHLWAAMEQSGMTVKSGSYSDTQRLQRLALYTGWQGKRQGYSGGAHVNWAF